MEKSLDPELHETVYTVDYQDVRIIVLNSTEKLEQQTKYLEDQLKNCTAKWKIVTCHHSVFSPPGGGFKFARENWKPLLDKYNVDLVLNGHDHTYARGHVPVVQAIVILLNWVRFMLHPSVDLNSTDSIVSRSLLTNHKGTARIRLQSRRNFSR